LHQFGQEPGKCFRFTPSIDGNDSNQDGRLGVMPENSTESLDISHNTNTHTH